MRSATTTRKNSGSKAAPTTGRRERNKLHKLQRIRQAAAELFHELGFEETTTQAIAERADIGAGTLFLYARTKEDLLAIVMGNDIKETMQKACSSISPGLSLPDQAYYAYSRILRYHARNRELSRYYVRERTLPRVYRRNAREVPPAPALVEALRGVIERDQRAGQLSRSYSAEAISWRVFALYYGVLVHLLLGRTSERESLVELRDSFEMLFNGLRGSLNPDKDAAPP